MAIRKVTATGYLVIVPEFNYNKTSVTGAHIDRYRVAKPSLKQGEIVVRVKLNFDADQLLAAIPTIEVDIDGFRTPITEMFAGAD